MKTPGHVLLVLEATIGGTRRHVRELALGLAARGWKVDLVYSLFRDPRFIDDLALFRKAGIGCNEIPMHRGFSPLADMLAVRRLRALAKRLHPDIVHCHSTKAGLVGRLALRGMTPKVIYTPHCWAFQMDSPLRSLYRLVEKTFIPFTDLLLAVCKDEARLGQELGYPPEKIRIAYNGIDAAEYKRQAPKSREIVFIGRAARQKGLDILLEAYRRILRQRPGTRLSVMSDVSGRFRAELLEVGAEIVPFGSQKESAAFLASGAVLAMPSRWEAFPYLLLEAMAAGVPIVASDVGGVREAVRDGESSILVPPGQAARVAEDLIDLLDNPARRNQLAQKAQVKIADFTRWKMIESIESAYCG